MNFDKIIEEFLSETLKENTKCSREELVSILKEVKDILLKNKDKNLEEIIYLFLPNLINSVHEILKKYSVPGYVIENNSGLINILAYGGNIDSKNNPMKKEALFDLASISKMFTQIISYNLIKEGYYNFDSKVSDLNPKYKNAGDLDIKTIMEFSFIHDIDGNIKDAKSIEEANDILHTLSVKQKGIYNYNDYGLMCLKDVMEYITGLSYEELFKKYIVDKLQLHSTFLNIPKDKKELVTGTPNASILKNNDMKAIKLGGFSGHAGVFSSSDDLIKVVKNLYINKSFFPSEYLYHAYTESEVSKAMGASRGIMGNSTTGNNHFIGKFSSNREFAFQGSTRTQVNVGMQNGILSASTILLNPSSMCLERAREFERKVNRKIVTEYNFEGQDYVQISSQLFLPAKDITSSIGYNLSKLKFILSFINYLLKHYEPNYSKQIDIELKDDDLKK